MTANIYTEHLKQSLKVIENDMERARNKLVSGSVAGKAEALRELSKLQARRKNIEERLNAAAAAHAENWSDAKSGFREEIDGLADTLENWIMRSI